MIEGLPWFTNMEPEMQALTRALWYGLIALIVLAGARGALRIAIDIRAARRDRSVLKAAVAAISLAMVAVLLWLAWSVTARILEVMPQ